MQVAGSFVRLGEAKLSSSDTDIVLLTHLHIDHVGELPGLFKARAVGKMGPIVFNIWGPSGASSSCDGAHFPATSQLLELLFGTKGSFSYVKDFSAPMTIRAHGIAAPSAAGAKPQSLYAQRGLAIAGHHGDAPQ